MVLQNVKVFICRNDGLKRENSTNPVETEMETGINWDRSWTIVSVTNENI